MLRTLRWWLVRRLLRTRFPGVPTLSAEALRRRLASPDPPHLLDVRTAEEYAVSHLPGAVRVPPETDGLPEPLKDAPRDTPIVAYCSVGYRSAKLVARLQEAGFTHAANLDGSIFGWANSGHPVVRAGRPVREVHPYDARWGRLLDRHLHAEQVTSDSSDE